MRRASQVFRCVALLVLLLALLAPLGAAPALAQGSDSDGDLIADARDNCPDTPNTTQFDADDDGIGDACDPLNGNDTDADLIPNVRDNCPDIANTGQTDWDRDGLGDACDPTPTGEPDTDTDTSTDTGTDIDTSTDTDVDTDTDSSTDTETDTDTGTTPTLPDSDGDGVPDNADNCALVSNTNQANADGDPFGDACDPTPDGGLVPGDADHDLIPDDRDNCPSVPNTFQFDTDGDGIGDACDTPDAPAGARVSVALNGPDQVLAPDTIIYTVKVTRLSNQLTTVILSQELPRASGLHWTTSTPGCRMLDVRGQQRLLCAGIVLRATGDTFTATVSSATPATASLCDTALTTTAVADPNAGPSVTSTAASTVVRCSTSLAVNTVATDEVEPGEAVRYGLTVTNTGDHDAADVALTVPLPSGITWAVDDGFTFDTCTIANENLSCTDSLLPSGENRIVGVTGTLPAVTASCELDLAFTATATAFNADPASASGDSAITCTPDVQITLTTTPDNGAATAGDEIAFIITLTNDGFGVADDTGFIIDHLPVSELVTQTLAGDAPDRCGIFTRGDMRVLNCTGITLTGTDGADGGADTSRISVTAQTQMPESPDTCAGATYNATTTLAGDPATDDSATITVSCPTATELCMTQATAAGYNIALFDTITGGTSGVDTFTNNDGDDLFCGFGGNDTLDTLGVAEVFLGGPGKDSLTTLTTQGDFRGGAGDDHVDTLSGGSFFGDDGDDTVTTLSSGSFYGGSGDDRVATMSDGYFDGNDGQDIVTSMSGGESFGGPGIDTVVTLSGGSFFGDDDNDIVTTLSGGAFYGYAGDDHVDTMSSGYYSGGLGDNSITIMSGGTFLGGPDTNSITTMSGGLFSGGPDADTVITMTGGTFNGGDGDDTVTNLGDPATAQGTGVFNGEGGIDTVSNTYSGTFDPGPQP